MYIGRETEHSLLEYQHRLDLAQLWVIYGRRRIGKTELIRQFCKDKPCLRFEGLEGEDAERQIDYFLHQLAEQEGRPPYAMQTWDQIFHYLTEKIGDREQVLVLDELPWMASGRKGLVSLIKSYWDRYWKHKKHLTVILCGSMASYMHQHLVRGNALFGRKTVELKLEPLSISECVRYFGKHFPVADVMQLYMTTGGIPKYLEQVDVKQSMLLNINRLCLRKNGFLVDEFSALFREQVRTEAVYLKICQQLLKGRMSHSDLAQAVFKNKSVNIGRYLDILIGAGFVAEESVVDVGRARLAGKERLYVLSDEYIRFYLSYIGPHRQVIKANDSGFLYPTLVKPSWDIYAGFLFERLVKKHMSRLLELLDIPLELVQCYGPVHNRKLGVQIDLLIIRTDRRWSLIEIKYHKAKVGPELIAEVQAKLAKLQQPMDVRVEKVLIAFNGASAALKQKAYFDRIIDGAMLNAR